MIKMPEGVRKELANRKRATEELLLSVSLDEALTADEVRMLVEGTFISDEIEFVEASTLPVGFMFFKIDNDIYRLCFLNTTENPYCFSQRLEKVTKVTKEETYYELESISMN